MSGRPFTRRAFLGASLTTAASLAACSSPLPLIPPQPNDRAAADRLAASAAAHGLDAYRGIRDIAVSYAGQWRPFVDGIQPAIVDASYRGGSEERLLPHAGIVAQSYRGTAGHKQVAWRRGTRDATDLGRIAVWRNDVPSTDRDTLDASALVAECYGLFLLGPLWFADRVGGDQPLAARAAGTERVDGRHCDVVEVWATPGFGRVALDRVAFCIDRRDDVTRRVRFTLEGTPNSQGAVAEVDTFDPTRIAGVLWPTRSYERIRHPLRLPAHDWHLTGLDVNRGFGEADVTGAAFTGPAAAPARPLAG